MPSREEFVVQTQRPKLESLSPMEEAGHGYVSLILRVGSGQRQVDPGESPAEIAQQGPCRLR